MVEDIILCGGFGFGDKKIREELIFENEIEYNNKYNEHTMKIQYKYNENIIIMLTGFGVSSTNR